MAESRGLESRARSVTLVAELSRADFIRKRSRAQIAPHVAVSFWRTEGGRATQLLIFNCNFTERQTYTSTVPTIG
jgi:hypothetical protein